MQMRAAQILTPTPFVSIMAALLLTVLAIGTWRVAGHRPDSNLPAVQPEQSRALRFEDAEGGIVHVRDAKSNALITEFGVGEGAFVRATLRALVHDRRKKAVTADGNFRLDLHKAKQLYLIDEATGRAISLNAFGPDNAAVFAAFMSNQKGEHQ